MTVYHNIHELIGHTPMVELTQFPMPDDVHIYAKLEYLNPGGSIKDRLGVELIDEAFRTGKLTKGGTLVEPTAGNTGIGLAMAAINKGIDVICVVPEKFSIEKQMVMKALGANIIHTATSEGMAGAIRRTEQLLKEIPNSYSPSQFSNPANPETYYKTLGPEIWQDLDGRIDIFIAGAGTGGTFMGTAKFLKEKNPLI